MHSTPPDGQPPEAIAALRREAAERRQSYRERALKILPHVCASCGRSFEGRRLRELTVHHKDHNHENNPPDGSNWELLCVYCHEHEHEKELTAKVRATGASTSALPPPSTFAAFEGLDAMLKMPGESGDKDRQ